MELTPTETIYSILWYNDYEYDVDKLIAYLEKQPDEFELIDKDKFVEITGNKKYFFDYTEEHCIYMMLVGMFGDWGTSIRNGHISDKKGLLEFLKGYKKSNKIEEIEVAER